MKNEHKWISYDFANSVFATSVISGFFPILLRKYWATSLNSEEVTLALGLVNSFISASLFFILPIAGYFLDKKKSGQNKILFTTALLGGLSTATLFFVSKGDHQLALALYILSFLLFALGNTQCDALLQKVTKNRSSQNLDRLSSLGYLFGYLGGGLCLLLQTLFIWQYTKNNEPSYFPVKLAFLSAGLWWIVFSLPLLSLKLEQVKSSSTSFFKETKTFLSSLNKKALFFLAAFFLYIDVVFTTFKMAVDFGLSLGLSEFFLIGILIYVQIIGVPGTLFMNKIAQKHGNIKALYFGIFCYGLALALSPFTKSIYMFTLLATLIGLGQGGLQALSRSYFSYLVPKEKQGIGFGFLNVFGKLSAVLGPLIVGLTAFAFKSNQISVLSLLPFLVLGAYFLKKSEEA